MYSRYFLLTSETKMSCTRKLTAQTARTKISCLTGARNHRGNMSLTVVMRASTFTNWGRGGNETSYVSSYQFIALSTGCMTIAITCVSTARRMSIRKKQTDQNCGRGIMAVA